MLTEGRDEQRSSSWRPPLRSCNRAHTNAPSTRAHLASAHAHPPQPAWSDLLLRLTGAGKVAAKRAAPPQAPLKEGEPITAERVEEHLKVRSADYATWGVVC